MLLLSAIQASLLLGLWVQAFAVPDSPLTSSTNPRLSVPTTAGAMGADSAFSYPESTITTINPHTTLHTVVIATNKAGVIRAKPPMREKRCLSFFKDTLFCPTPGQGLHTRKRAITSNQLAPVVGSSEINEKRELVSLSQRHHPRDLRSRNANTDAKEQADATINSDAANEEKRGHMDET